MSSTAKSVYIHMPFCKTKCPYCDFASFTNNDLFQKYTQALINEIEFRIPESFMKERPKIETIFFGGGTPSLHSPKEFEEIFFTLNKYFEFSESIEITIEANPGTISMAKLEELIGTGINRISVGVQTFDEKLLQKLGRGHSLEDSYRAIDDLRALSLKSWSFDLIYGLPGQDLESWIETIDKALSFHPPHISAYALSIEEGTPYAKLYNNSKHPELPQEELLVEMYHLANQKFFHNNLMRYEISNWAKLGHEARHNLTYWRAEEYYAFGLSSHGYLNSVRYSNTRDLKEYLDIFTNRSLNRLEEINLGFTKESNTISPTEKLEEKIILNLRLTSGLNLDDQILELIDYDSLLSLKKQGYIEEAYGNLKLSDKAMMLSNRVINQLVK